MSVIEYQDLKNADLVVGNIYRSAESVLENGQLTGEPLNPLLGVGNQGGFRPLSRNRNQTGKFLYIVITSTGREHVWPDSFDKVSGTYIYFGDNKSSEKDLHATRGNKILRDIFTSDLDQSIEVRESLPPFFIFESTGHQRDYTFRGIGVPGQNESQTLNCLTAVWQEHKGSKYINYRAEFTVLSDLVVSKDWLKQAQKNGKLDYTSNLAPPALTHWVQTGQRIGQKSS